MPRAARLDDGREFKPPPEGAQSARFQHPEGVR
jgi:hypothetical protein